MANVANINGLVLRIRQRTDQINSTTYDDATELKPWIKDSLAQLYEVLCSRWQDYYTISRPLSLIGGQAAYSLPADFRALDSVWMMYNQGQSRYQLNQFEADMMDQLQQPSQFYGYGFQPTQYRIIRNLLWILPVINQDAQNAVEIFYVPQYQAPLLDYTSIDDILPNGWEEWCVLDVMQKMAVKSRLIDINSVIQAQQSTERRLLAAASVRSGIAPRMRDAMRPRFMYGPATAPQGAVYWSAP